MFRSTAQTEAPPPSPRVLSTAFHATTQAAGRKAACVAALGDLDGAAAPQLEHALRHALRRGRTVVLDLRGLTRANTAGVRVIVEAAAAGQRLGARLIVVRGLSQVDRLLALTGASGDVEIVDLAEGEPALQALWRVARLDRANLRAQARQARLVMFAGKQQAARANRMTRGIEALIAHQGRNDRASRANRPRRAVAGASLPTLRRGLIGAASGLVGDDLRAETQQHLDGRSE